MRLANMEGLEKREKKEVQKAHPERFLL